MAIIADLQDLHSQLPCTVFLVRAAQKAYLMTSWFPWLGRYLLRRNSAMLRVILLHWLVDWLFPHPRHFLQAACSLQEWWCTFVLLGSGFVAPQGSWYTSFLVAAIGFWAVLPGSCGGFRHWVTTIRFICSPCSPHSYLFLSLGPQIPTLSLGTLVLLLCMWVMGRSHSLLPVYYLENNWFTSYLLVGNMEQSSD